MNLLTVPTATPPSPTPWEPPPRSGRTSGRPPSNASTKSSNPMASSLPRKIQALPKGVLSHFTIQTLQLKLTWASKSLLPYKWALDARKGRSSSRIGPKERKSSPRGSAVQAARSTPWTTRFGRTKPPTPTRHRHSRPCLNNRLNHTRHHHIETHENRRKLVGKGMASPRS